MRGRTSLLLAVVVAVLAAVTALLLIRSQAAGPGMSASPSDAGVAVEAGRSQAIPTEDPLPWTIAEWIEHPGVFGPRPEEGMPGVRVDGLVASADRFIGWGRMPAPGANEFNDIGAVFLSADGDHWQQVPIVHGVNAVSTSEIRGVAVGPHGYLAYGGVCCRGEGPALWHSTDAVAWERVELAADGEQLYMDGVVGVRDGWVAVGSSSTGTGHVWHSTDAVTWDSVLESESGGSWPAMGGLAADGDRLVAVGTVSGPDGTYDGAVWVSDAGREWDPIAVDEPTLVGEGEVTLDAVVPFAGGLFVTGGFGSTEDRQRCEQQGSAVPLEDGPMHRALSCGWGTEHVWVAADDDSWERADPMTWRGNHPIEFRLVRAGGPGLILLGESSRPGSPDSTLYASANGVDWVPVAPETPIGAASPTAFASRGRDLVAVTEFFDGTASHWSAWTVTIR